MRNGYIIQNKETSVMCPYTSTHMYTHTHRDMHTHKHTNTDMPDVPNVWQRKRLESVIKFSFVYWDRQVFQVL